MNARLQALLDDVEVYIHEDGDELRVHLNCGVAAIGGDDGITPEDMPGLTQHECDVLNGKIPPTATLRGMDVLSRILK